MKKVFVLTMCFFIALQSVSSQTTPPNTETPLTVKPVQFIFNSPVGDDLPFSVKPMRYDDPGYVLTYLVSGSGMTSVSTESLKIEHIKTKDGADISRDGKGMPAYRPGGFPKVSPDGKHASFSVIITPDSWMQPEMPDVKGTIRVQTASKSETKTAEFKIGNPQSLKIGPFTVSTGNDSPESGPMSGMPGIFGGGDQDDGLELTVNGKRSILSKITVIADGTTYEYSGRSSFGDSSTYSFSKPSGDKFTVSITYWTDLNEQTVSFGE